MTDPMLSLLIKVLGVVSIALVLPLVYLFFRVYRLQRSVILLGLPLGFMFLAISYIFLGVHLIYPLYPAVDAFSSSLMWIRVATQTWGLALITASYFLAGRSQKASRHNYLAITLWSVVSVICIAGLLLVINPSGLSIIYSYNALFTIANIGLLTYICFFIVRKLELAKGGVSGLISAPVAFAFMWLGQFSFLIWKLDGGMAALIGSQIAPIIGLVLLIRIYYMTSKRCHELVDG